MTRGRGANGVVVDPYRLPASFRKIPNRLNLAGEVLRFATSPDVENRPALLYEAGAVSYRELNRRVGAFTAGLRSVGIRRGDHVLIRMHNSPEFAVAFLGLVSAGAIPVLQNSLATSAEVKYVVESSEPVAAITFAELAEPFREVGGLMPLGLIVARGEPRDHRSFEALLDDPGGAQYESEQVGASEPAFLVYTSGTTGKPKGIVHAHRWIVALGDSNALRVPPEPSDVVLSTGEWSFIAALGQNLLFPLRNGVSAAILEGRATPERVLEAIQKFRVTLLYSVATVYRRLLAMESFEKRHDLSSLRGCNSTGESLEKETYLQWKRRVGCDIWEHYGISEMQMVFGQGPLIPLRPGSVGIPLPGTKVAVLDDQYQPVPPGTVGNLLIDLDNPGFFLGYHRNPELTAHVTRNGWYHTGDLAWQDEDGYIWIAGRTDDCFKSRGIFISPVEIENVMREHPTVVEACVVPQPDSEIGNRIRAVVVLRNNANAAPEHEAVLKDFLRSRLARYKVPHSIEFVDALPRSPVGKILRRELRSS